MAVFHRCKCICGHGDGPTTPSPLSSVPTGADLVFEKGGGGGVNLVPDSDTGDATNDDSSKHRLGSTAEN